ncbi:calcium signal-modulating cyclophilin ligand [Megalops cyprinoides]|uniref:calcium signal-modulating cyclophilin ligand n=1 Tax=Megalops cyprinoides TaxID=118141 RepID=UPI0018649046|nr:calcium signal-modulating cyclophilin ligand [Megalops cyprinoides]
MEVVEETTEKCPEEKSTLSASRRRAEIRRRKLLMNSEDRMNRIVGYGKSDGEPNVDRHGMKPRFHLDLDRTEPWSTSVSSTRLSPYAAAVASGNHHVDVLERSGSPLLDSSDILSGDAEEEVTGALRQRSQGDVPPDGVPRSPRRGLQKYLSRFDDAVRLRAQVAGVKTPQDGGSEPEELDSFRLFRVVGSVILAIAVRVFICKYVSIFAPFLTLQLAYMGLYKYFPKTEKKMKTTVLTAALLLSGIPAEVINRSMDTYSKMGDVFTDLCVYFFTFILCHEILLLFGSEIP